MGNALGAVVALGIGVLLLALAITGRAKATWAALRGVALAPPGSAPIGGGSPSLATIAYQSAQAAADMPHTTPAMQRGLAAMANLSPLVTSVMHGAHVADSAHYVGRAVDVGAFGGADVGDNAATQSAVSQAIGTKLFSKIGTLGAIANDPNLQVWAAANNVVLFTDEGSGPHVHLQVAN